MVGVSPIARRMCGRYAYLARSVRQGSWPLRAPAASDRAMFMGRLTLTEAMTSTETMASTETMMHTGRVVRKMSARVGKGYWGAWPWCQLTEIAGQHSGVLRVRESAGR